MCIAILKKELYKDIPPCCGNKKAAVPLQLFFSIPLHSAWHLLGEVFLQKENGPLVFPVASAIYK